MRGKFGMNSMNDYDKYVFMYVHLILFQNKLLFLSMNSGITCFEVLRLRGWVSGCSLPLILLRDGRKSINSAPVSFSSSAAAVPDPLPEQERRLGVGHVGDLLGQRRIHPRTAPGGGRRPQPGGLQVMILNKLLLYS